MSNQALMTHNENGADHPLVAFRRQLETRSAEYKLALPAGMEVGKFQRTVVTAVQADPELLRADRQSLLLACIKAAQDGLLPDKREAALVIFNERRKGQDGQWYSHKIVAYMPMAYGLRKKILQSGEVTDIYAQVVYRAEIESGRFIYEEGTSRTLRHKPDLGMGEDDITDDNIIAAYSVATFKDGTQSYEVMRRAEINKVRQMSQTGALGKTDRNGKPIPPKGPWVDWFSEMAKKTVMRRHSKTLPMSGDVIDPLLLRADDDMAAESTDRVLSSDQPDTPMPRLEDQAGGTGDEEQSEEEIARQLDAGFDPKTGEIAREEDEEKEKGQPEPQEGKPAKSASKAKANGKAKPEKDEEKGQAEPQREAASAAKTGEPSVPASTDATTPDAARSDALGQSAKEPEDNLWRATSLDEAKRILDSAEFLPDVRSRMADLLKTAPDEWGDAIIAHGEARMDDLKGRGRR